MHYWVYILAAFGVIFILIVLIRLVMWCFKCDIDTQFVPIGGSDLVSVSVRSNSLPTEAEVDTIDAMDKMLEQYTKPKTIVSRQCICPFCTKEIDKLLVTVKSTTIVDEALITYPSSDNISQNTFKVIEEENNEHSNEKAVDPNEDGEELEDSNAEEDRSIGDVIEIMCEGEETRVQIIQPSGDEPEQQCRLYNNVVSELKLKFESL